jgi:hypothetical protein
MLNATVSYELVLPDKESKRVLFDVNNPLVPKSFTEEVDRNIGDLIQIDLSGTYEITRGWSISFLYDYQYAFEDSVSGTRGLQYQSLEDETELKAHEYIICLSYSTIPLFMEKKFPFPLVAHASYRNRFAGMNVTKSEYIDFGLRVFF